MNWRRWLKNRRPRAPGHDMAQFDLKTPFTRDQSQWLQDSFTALMAGYQLQGKIGNRLGKSIERILTAIRKNTERKKPDG